MTMKEITDGLKNLLLDNHYNPVTIQFYEREWKKIQSFLMTEYGDEGFDMERGLAYLEKQYGFQTKYNDGTLSQQRVQLLRVVHMLEDYRLHQVILCLEKSHPAESVLRWYSYGLLQCAFKFRTLKEYDRSLYIYLYGIYGLPFTKRNTTGQCCLPGYL